MCGTWFFLWQMGVFCFPAGATLPLHDHPEMVVLSKLLYGSVRVRSYDWVDDTAPTPPRSAARKCGLARVVAADEVRRAPCEASVLFPRSGGNLHAFTAVTPCAILDVLTPPYSEEHGRPSTYFADVSIPSLPGELFVHGKFSSLVTQNSASYSMSLTRCAAFGVFLFIIRFCVLGGDRSARGLQRRWGAVSWARADGRDG